MMARLHVRRSLTLTVPAVAAAAAVALSTAAGPAGATAPPTAAERPTKVVIIVVDALSKEIVETYHMKNVKGLFPDEGVGRPGASVRR